MVLTLTYSVKNHGNSRVTRLARCSRLLWHVYCFIGRQTEKALSCRTS